MNPKSIIKKENQSIKKKDKLIDKGLSYLKKTILIVDDEYTFRLLIKEALESIPLDLEILLAEDGTKAIQLLKSKKGNIDLISTDMIHPGIDGRELVKIVKQNYPNIKIIVCSAAGSLIDRNYFAYFDYFLDKPFDIREYTSIVEKFLSI